MIRSVEEEVDGTIYCLESSNENEMLDPKGTDSLMGLRPFSSFRSRLYGIDSTGYGSLAITFYLSNFRLTFILEIHV